MFENELFKHFTFIMLGDVAYRNPGGVTRHIIAQRLSMHYPVYYVNPPGSMLPRIFNKRRRQAPIPGQLISEAEYNLRVIHTPRIAFPLENRWKGVDEINQIRFARFLQKVLNRQKVRNFILWSFRYNSNIVMQNLRPDVAIYHAIGNRNDDLPLADKSVIDDIEMTTMQTANLVFTASDLIYRHLVRMKKETHYAPLGVDYKLFHTALANDLLIPEDLAAIPEPRVGYIGMIEHWLDLDLIEHLAATMPDVSFVFIGRYGPWSGVERLMNYPNVYLLGARSRGSLPTYLKWMSACLIPFKLNELTLHTHPMKIYEYLAAGKPVVSTPIHEVAKFSEFIEIASRPVEFAAKLRQAIGDTDVNRANSRAEIARHYSWNQRITEMLEQISGLLIGAEERPW